MSQTPSIVAVDAGGSSTKAAWVDAHGRVLGRGSAGPANPGSVGAADALAQVVAAAQQACPDRSAAVVSAVIAGVIAAPLTDADLTGALASAGWTRPRGVVNSDVVGAYFSGTLAPDGGVLITGTGAVGGRILDGALASMRDGLGWLLGDAGSGTWIARQALRAVAASLDQRGPTTSMATAVLASLGLNLHGGRGAVDAPGRDPRLNALVTAVSGRRPPELAGIATVVIEWATRDEVAAQIVASAADHLADTVDSLHLHPDDPVVLAGGLVGHGGALRDELVARLDRPVVTVVTGLAGAAVLGLRTAGVVVDDDLQARLSAIEADPLGR